jgi:hypothetical protein
MPTIEAATAVIALYVVLFNETTIRSVVSLRGNKKLNIAYNYYIPLYTVHPIY